MSELPLERLHALMRLRQEVESLEGGSIWRPATDWLQSEQELTLIMDLPGIAPHSLSISSDEATVVVNGEREALELTGELLTQERPNCDTVTRTLTFPVPVLPHTARARYRNGVLVVHFERTSKVIDAENDVANDVVVSFVE